MTQRQRVVQNKYQTGKETYYLTINLKFYYFVILYINGEMQLEP